MTAGEPATEGGDGLAERYEQLRRRALEGAPDGFRLGLAVLQRQGMAAWINAWKELAYAFPPQRPTNDAHGSDAVVAVLASMALACAGAG
ncbi:MAG: hypothetical protein ABR540_22595 [Acidimicrobiales bacterium]